MNVANIIVDGQRGKKKKKNEVRRSLAPTRLLLDDQTDDDSDYHEGMRTILHGPVRPLFYYIAT